MPPKGPFPLPDHVRSIVSPRELCLVVDRRGSTVWDVRTDDGRYAVKLGYPTTKHTWTALAPAREAAVLHQLDTDDVHHGEWAEGTWNAQPWHPGTSLFDRWQPGRHPTEPAEPNLADALASATALAELHDAGWAHGDVQPNHLLLQEGRATLIDLALAHGHDVPPGVDFSYRGCLVHYEAPEISHRILTSGTAVPTKAADVYALAASWFISATGWRHVSYPDDADREEQRRAIVEKPHRRINVPGPLGQLMARMMTRSPTERPTAAEVCAELRTRVR
ncbi:protein kinase domain-containing protein [Streptomyces noursei]|uniref:protein kinase domain-containing protein n=1 Tax=Streptomyces noursei TaxID=1971 RepID=UPI00382AD224